jgi:hypothetical protein
VLLRQLGTADGDLDLTESDFALLHAGHVLLGVIGAVGRMLGLAVVEQVEAVDALLLKLVDAHAGDAVVGLVKSSDDVAESGALGVHAGSSGLDRHLGLGGRHLGLGGSHLGVGGRNLGLGGKNLGVDGSLLRRDRRHFGLEGRLLDRSSHPDTRRRHVAVDGSDFESRRRHVLVGEGRDLGSRRRHLLVGEGRDLGHGRSHV